MQLGGLGGAQGHELLHFPYKECVSGGIFGR